MPKKANSSRPTVLPWRRIFLVWLFLIIVVTSFPWVVGPPQWGRIRWIPLLDVLHSPLRRGVDAIVNFFLYLPLGFSYVRIRSSTTIKSMLEAGLLGLLLAGSCELYQVFSPVRFPTMTDVLTNTLGALGGASIASRIAVNQDRALRGRG